MKGIMKMASRYLTTMRLVDMAVLKVCLLSLGILIGLLIAKDTHRAAFTIFLVVFAATYIPAMWRFIGFALQKEKR